MLPVYIITQRLIEKKKRIKCKHDLFLPSVSLSLSIPLYFFPACFFFFFNVYFLLLGPEFSDLMVIKSVLFMNTNWFITRFDLNAFYFLVTYFLDGYLYKINRTTIMYFPRFIHLLKNGKQRHKNNTYQLITFFCV